MPKPPSQRPFRSRSDRDLAREFVRALEAGDGIAGAHCIHERWMRGDFPAHIESALDALWKRAAKSIPDWLPMRYVSWLPTAYDVAARFTAHANGKGGGRSNIYLILLDYSDRRGDDHGVYVGMSRYSPAQRFDQHKSGIDAPARFHRASRAASMFSAKSPRIQRS